MTLDQIIEESAAKPTQVDAFTAFMADLQQEMNDVSVGNRLPHSLKAKYDTIFSQTTSKANEILHAIEDGKPALEPLNKPASQPGGPVSPHQTEGVFVDKPRNDPKQASDPKAPNNPNAVDGSKPAPKVPSPFGFEQPSETRAPPV